MGKLDLPKVSGSAQSRSPSPLAFPLGVGKFTDEITLSWFCIPKKLIIAVNGYHQKKAGTV